MPFFHSLACCFGSRSGDSKSDRQRSGKGDTDRSNGKPKRRSILQTTEITAPQDPTTCPHSGASGQAPKRPEMTTVSANLYETTDTLPKARRRESSKSQQTTLLTSKVPPKDGVPGPPQSPTSPFFDNKNNNKGPPSTAAAAAAASTALPASAVPDRTSSHFTASSSSSLAFPTTTNTHPLPSTPTPHAPFASAAPLNLPITQVSPTDLITQVQPASSSSSSPSIALPGITDAAALRAVAASYARAAAATAAPSDGTLDPYQITVGPTSVNHPKEVSEQVLAQRSWLLPPLDPSLSGRKCLVLDLDETLVHSSFRVVPDADFVVDVQIEKTVHQVYILKRPGVDEFLRKCGELFEVVVFTASLAKYADPVLDYLDTTKAVHHRLFRESCLYYSGSFVKDLSILGRDLQTVLIVDNSPTSYIFHPMNAVPISSWFDSKDDTELQTIWEQLVTLSKVDNVMLALEAAAGVHNTEVATATDANGNASLPTETTLDTESSNAPKRTI